MAVICPTITAYDPHEYRSQMEQIEPFAQRIHVDLMDGRFTPKASPDLDHIWWPDNIKADVHLMYQEPRTAIDQLVRLNPHLIVIHFEADVNYKEFADRLHENGIKAGLAILQNTQLDEVADLINNFDQVLVFSGHLGFHGGEFDAKQLQKVTDIKKAYPDIEVAWDGGINDQNAPELVKAGVEVLNVGGFIQKSADPLAAYKKLQTQLS